eukprot:CAMPEP_0119301014 /NCGR_PEP_ID=MMETSP1333-20130426/2880_1 /TAXON_ID=418940 /ORGANISM="Scyphosphaera apsteinii, Strain RCC1455" /LENGTH=147 /DNA_ID=CAMNT_0007302979 /DNA_START=32 /DNA_END=475 /DNA_ORIENTATION=+
MAGQITYFALLCVMTVLSQARAEDARPAIHVSEGSRRAGRSSENIFSESESSGVDELTTKTVDAELQAVSHDILVDMRAHLDRRRLRSDADLIGSNKGVLKRVMCSIGAVLRSRYLRNSRRSVLLLIAAWLWYTTNTKLYTPPEFDD